MVPHALLVARAQRRIFPAATVTGGGRLLQCGRALRDMQHPDAIVVLKAEASDWQVWFVLSNPTRGSVVSLRFTLISSS